MNHIHQNPQKHAVPHHKTLWILDAHLLYNVRRKRPLTSDHSGNWMFPGWSVPPTQLVCKNATTFRAVSWLTMKKKSAECRCYLPEALDIWNILNIASITLKYFVQKSKTKNWDVLTKACKRVELTSRKHNVNWLESDGIGCFFRGKDRLEGL